MTVDFRARQERIAADVPPAVVHAMDCWVNWMRGGVVGRGYPAKSLVFVNGGINCFDDMDDEAANYAARSVDGVVMGLDLMPRTCIGIVWLGHTIYYRRVDVEQVAKEAMQIIWRGLAARGVV